MGRWARRGGKAGQIRPSDNRRPAAQDGSGDDPRAWPRRRAALAPGAWNRRSPCLAGTRDEEHFGGDDVRYRYFRSEGARARPALALRESRAAAEAARTRRQKRDAETAAARLQAAYPHALERRADPARHPPFRGRARSSIARARRCELPSHRRIVI